MYTHTFTHTLLYHDIIYNISIGTNTHVYVHKIIRFAAVTGGRVPKHLLPRFVKTHGPPPASRQTRPVVCVVADYRQSIVVVIASTRQARPYHDKNNNNNITTAASRLDHLLWWRRPPNEEFSRTFQTIFIHIDTSNYDTRSVFTHFSFTTQSSLQPKIKNIADNVKC